ncbi:MAG: PTS transporter subunit EIIC [Clostridiaceae bacterium]|nr:PTS transporter subunit EIIC [Clostridiaceae bacterium]MCI9483336.1 PTS transporter subunit EIIC [Clostridiaceae bacterium]NBH78594.1 PTS glucose transporter subunit IIBC [Clostridiaceae bacterium]
MMKFMQKLGKSLMLPVAVLPIAGILSGIGYWMCPSTMQGGEVAGLVQMIGFFLVQASLALVDGAMMALLFAVGVAVGMADDHDGTAGLAGLVSWLMMTKLLSTGVVTTLIPSIADDATKVLAFDKVQNAFIGILAGLIGSYCYNKFKNTKLPDWLAFFSGKRCVAIVTAVVSIVASAILLFVWPILFGVLVSIGNAILGMEAVGAGIYAFLNRLLIPTGLHHALNNVFWFPTIGIGDLTHFWAGETAADVGWSLGMYMSGFFPCMMFGIPGAALAIVHCAKPEKRQVAIGLVVSAAICAFVCGVTEPFEFGFMFLAPILYVAYALLYGIFTFVTVLVGFRGGFAFSAGATDLVFSASLPAAAKTLLIIPLGIAAFAVFYIVFRVMITALNLKTPGREDDDEEDEKKIVLANNDFTSIAKIVLEGLGGKDNITSVDNCITRLRLEIKDYTLVDEKKIKSAGVAGVIRPSKTAVQVIVGTQVQHVADEFKKLM